MKWRWGWRKASWTSSSSRYVTLALPSPRSLSHLLDSHFQSGRTVGVTVIFLLLHQSIQTRGFFSGLRNKSRVAVEPSARLIDAVAGVAPDRCVFYFISTARHRSRRTTALFPSASEQQHRRYRFTFPAVSLSFSTPPRALPCVRLHLCMTLGVCFPVSRCAPEPANTK